MTDLEKYEANYTPEQKTEAERVRKIIRQAVPAATEQLSYGVPAFRYQNRLLIGYAAFKNHYSLFPNSGPIAKHQADLKDVELSKGTIKYTQDNLISAELITKLVKESAKLIDQKAKAR